MRRLFTSDEARARGLNRAQLRWGEEAGRWRRIDVEVYGVGQDDPTPLDRARAAVLAVTGVASGRLAGVLHELDSITLAQDITVEPHRNGRRKGVRRRHLDPERIVQVGGVPCTDGMQTLIDLAASVDDLVWEQALESALRKRLLAVDDLDLFGLFIELDGEHHKGQPVYDASRETAVVAATGWLCGRFTWTEVTRHAAPTRRRLARLVERARQRPVR